MRLHGVSIQSCGDHVRLVGEVERGSGERCDLYFAYPERYQQFIADSADAFAVAMLVPAMVTREPLHIVPPISPRLVFHLPRIRDIFCSWFPEFPRIDLDLVPAKASEPSSPAPRAATFFSGGVDSFYTLLKYQSAEQLPSPLTHIIFMRGTETKLESGRDLETAQHRVEEVAAAVGVDCIAGETNVRGQILSRYWETHFVGSALAAIALSLARGFGYVCIPSSRSYDYLGARGSTPLVDERYSTEAVQIVHDGAEVSRAEKVASIVDWNGDVSLRHLRVCLRNWGAGFNCGECYKCIRTLVALRALGVDDRAETFPRLANDRWAQVNIADDVYFLEENLALARARGIDRDLIKRLDSLVRLKRRRMALHQFLENSPLADLLPAIARTKRALSGRP
jgi:hypothetical protein